MISMEAAAAHRSNSGLPPLLHLKEKWCAQQPPQPLASPRLPMTAPSSFAAAHPVQRTVQGARRVLQQTHRQGRQNLDNAAQPLPTQSVEDMDPDAGAETDMSTSTDTNRYIGTDTGTDADTSADTDTYADANVIPARTLERPLARGPKQIKDVIVEVNRTLHIVMLL